VTRGGEMDKYRKQSDLKEIAEWKLIEEAWEILLPYLKRAAFRLHVNPLSPGILNNYSDEFLKHIFGPPDSPIEEKKQYFAGQIFAWLFPEKEIDFVIARALPEIEEAYKVIKKKGGGWVSHTDRGVNKRKKAVLDWHQYSQNRLAYIKNTYLQDPRLFNPGGVGSQTKRNFIGRLLIKIIKDKVGLEITFQQANSHLRNLAKFKRSLHL
jgi:hypothetical protein